MAERRDRSREEPMDRETVMREYIFPQVNYLIELGFHESPANQAYMDALDVELHATSVLESRFRTQMQDILLPESIEDTSNLVLVVPNVHIDQQAFRLGIPGFSQWEPFVYPDKDLPQVPYAIEITRGDPNKNPKRFAFKANGLIDTLVSTDENGGLDSITQGLEKRGMRGLSAHELLAFVRQHPGDFDHVHGLKSRFTVQKSDIRYYPSVARVGNEFFCLRSGISHIPSSMAEILYTKKETQFAEPPSAK